MPFTISFSMWLLVFRCRVFFRWDSSGRADNNPTDALSDCQKSITITLSIWQKNLVKNLYIQESSNWLSRTKTFYHGFFNHVNTNLFCAFCFVVYLHVLHIFNVSSLKKSRLTTLRCPIYSLTRLWRWRLSSFLSCIFIIIIANMELRSIY